MELDGNSKLKTKEEIERSVLDAGNTNKQKGREDTKQKVTKNRKSKKNWTPICGIM